MAIGKRTIPPFREQDAQRFWAKIDRTPGQGPNGDCWIWIANRCAEYGQFKIQRSSYTANRVAYFLTTGDDPIGFQICHHCDNPPCCNPDHLFKDTSKGNAADMLRKGRGATGTKNGRYTHPESRAFGDRNGSRKHPERRPKGDSHWSRTNPEKLSRGESHYLHQHPELLSGANHPRARLTTDEITEIRRRYDAGGIYQYQLAAEFNTCQSHVGRIVNRKARKDS